MLTKLISRNFKGLPDCEIELERNVVFVGPNNSGKTTALQALSLWEAGLRNWLSKRLGEIQSRKRTGVTINRRDLITIPIGNTKYLWKKQRVRIGNTNSAKKQKTENVLITIIVEGILDGEVWSCGFDFDYSNAETFYCRPSQNDNNILNNPTDKQREMLQSIRMAFLPPMSGLIANEVKLEQGAIDVRIGEGQTAQVLRNLCYHFHQQNESNNWQGLCDVLYSLFGVTLCEPEYDPARSEISIYYYERDENNLKDRLELSSAGRGMLQTLLILTFLYLHRGAVVLLDEPDAHLEILRQKQIYEKIKTVAKENNGQVIVATHSEVVLNESAEHDTVIAFIGKPHKLNDRSQLAQSLVSIGWEQYFLAEQSGWVLYLEGATDLDMLRAFAKLLKHPVEEELKMPFCHFIGNNSPKNAEKHFYALKEAKKNLHGYALFDRIENTKIKSQNGLTEYSLKRRELENYFCNENILIRWARCYMSSDVTEPLLKHDEQAEQDVRENIMKECITEYTKLLIEYQRKADSLWSPKLKASDDVLNPLLSKFFERLGHNSQVQKARFYELISFMLPEEVDKEIAKVLNDIYCIASKYR
ncbi:MAG: AAA family ATPase [Planctomycetaceae bacterium]|jgi:AAA15 family ATPase/GTPase|nr:AAA family ATPase [Planctomycetaceae bacterium]